jgi:hypothetical protein
MTAPTLTSLEPKNTAALSDPDFTISCIGTGFDAESVIVWGGGDEPTTFVSDTEVTTLVKPSTGGTAGSRSVLIRNGLGEQSNALDFTLTEAVEPPVEPPTTAPWTDPNNVKVWSWEHVLTEELAPQASVTFPAQSYEGTIDANTVKLAVDGTMPDFGILAGENELTVTNQSDDTWARGARLYVSVRELLDGDVTEDIFPQVDVYVQTPEGTELQAPPNRDRDPPDRVRSPEEKTGPDYLPVDVDIVSEEGIHKQPPPDKDRDPLPNPKMTAGTTYKPAEGEKDEEEEEDEKNFQPSSNTPKEEVTERSKRDPQWRYANTIDSVETGPTDEEMAENKPPKQNELGRAEDDPDEPRTPAKRAQKETDDRVKKDVDAKERQYRNAKDGDDDDDDDDNGKKSSKKDRKK